jgi:hypothetical protein
VAFTFDPEVVLAAIEQCMTVVRPGEALAVRVSKNITEDEVAYLRNCAARAREGTGVTILFIAGEEFARVAIQPAEGEAT